MGRRILYWAGYEDLLWYTNGSKTKKDTGAGVYVLRLGLKHSFPLEHYTTDFQAEVMELWPGEHEVGF